MYEQKKSNQLEFVPYHFKYEIQVNIIKHTDKN